MTPAPHSIRRTLLARLMGPLVVLALLAGFSSYGLARHFTQVVLDQWLFDSAISLANRVRVENNHLSVDLSEAAREILEWDVVDRFFYEVTTDTGDRLAANAELSPPRQSGGPATYYESSVRGAAVRVLAVAIPLKSGERVIVKVAETLNKRNAIARQVLWLSVIGSLALVAASAALAWYGIGSGIETMERSVRRVRAHHASAPLEPIRVDSGVPSEVVPLLEEINDLMEDLSSANRMNQRFIADAAHQLRTPLATLRVQLEMARRERDPERHGRAIEDAVAALARMSHLLHQLLTLARADRDYAEVAERTDIGLIAREEVERRLDEAVALGVDLGYAGPSHQVLVKGRQELLREAVANLVDNALRHGSGGHLVTVGVGGERGGASPEIFVEDRGPGIAAAERDKVRDRFYRVPGSPGDGCGLGLSIVEEIARRCGASLLLEEASEGRGLRARLVFAS